MQYINDNTDKPVARDEVYYYFYVCKSCNSSKILYGYNYCPMCGDEIYWDYNMYMKKLERLNNELFGKLK